MLYFGSCGRSCTEMLTWNWLEGLWGEMLCEKRRYIFGWLEFKVTYLMFNSGANDEIVNPHGWLTSERCRAVRDWVWAGLNGDKSAPKNIIGDLRLRDLGEEKVSVAPKVRSSYLKPLTLFYSVNTCILQFVIQPSAQKWCKYTAISLFFFF